MIAVEEMSQKEAVVRKLEEMGLDQIAKWTAILPESKWESLFVSNWPTLAKKFGVQR